MQNYILKAEQVCLEKKIVPGYIVIQNKKITKISQNLDYKKLNLPLVEIDSSSYVIPSFIDIHIHGSNGADVMDADVDALKTISKSIYKHGVTSYLATTMTAPDEDISKSLQAIKNYNNYIKNERVANIVGVHLEGPFISPDKIGAQNPLFLQDSSVNKLSKWNNIDNNLIKKITIAPEIDNINSLINYCNKNKIVTSIGHTNCTAKQALNAINLGCSQATHLFNAMSGCDHRNPGATSAILMSKKVLAELIVDGIHLHQDTVKFAYEIKGSDNIALVTDAMNAQGYGEGLFSLGGQKVIVKNGEARLENGVLAGSVLTMNKAFENMIKFSNCSLLDAIKMTSTNQAKSLGLKKGLIAEGYDAEFVILDKNYQLQKVIS